MGKIIMYGISNCDMVKRAMAWFTKNNITFEFHDYKTSGITKDKLALWIQKAGLDIILNKRSTTWRSLPGALQKKMISEDAAIRVMVENTSLIKRPVIVSGKKILVGFDEDIFTREFLS
ncbi:MAG: Spx/MgsR family RNA polymerase-binding regulatory protein [Ferruginibacter sp.]